LSLAQQLGMEVPGLTFTRDGLEPILQSARTNYLLGSVYGSCGKSEEAKSRTGQGTRCGNQLSESSIVAGTGCWRSTSHGWQDQRLRHNHFNL
jgi:hypothetical protein